MRIFRKSLTSSLIVTAIIFLVALLAPLYYHDTIITDDVSIPELILTYGIIIWLKFFLYNLAGRKLNKNIKGEKHAGMITCFYVFYLIGVTIDALSVFAASNPMPDAGFAILGIIMYTVPLLMIGLVTLLIAHIIRNSQDPFRR